MSNPEIRKGHAWPTTSAALTPTAPTIGPPLMCLRPSYQRPKPIVPSSDLSGVISLGLMIPETCGHVDGAATRGCNQPRTRQQIEEY
jgi:hypothetical protein